MNYQGRLLDESGTPVNGNVEVAVAIYTNDEGGVSVYSEAVGQVAVQNGIYTFGFGTNTSPVSSALLNPECWLELSIDGSPLSPRQKLLAVPYAVRSREVETVSTNTSFSVAVVPGSALQPGAATSNTLAAGAVWVVHLGDDVDARYVAVAGDVMLGPLTNTAGYYGNGAGITNLPAEAYTETDPEFAGSVAADITGTDTSNWTAAYGWGDHAGAGYLTSETDPEFTNSVAAGITGTDTSNWTAAYGWGNHAVAGYLTSETDPEFTNSAAALISEAGSGSVITQAERDKLAGVAAGATSNLTDAALLSRANHTGAQAMSTVTGLEAALDGKLSKSGDTMGGDLDMGGNSITNISTGSVVYEDGESVKQKYVDASGDVVTGMLVVSNDVKVSSNLVVLGSVSNATYYGNGKGITNLPAGAYAETDPQFTGSAAAGITGTDTSNWATAYGWGDHGVAGYVETEADPVYAASVASGITGTETSNWTAAYGWGDHAGAGYLTVETDPEFTNSVAAEITGADTSNWAAAYGWGDHAGAAYLTSETDPEFTNSAAALITDAGSGSVITQAERDKLAGVAAGATSNLTDAALLSRANHTGSQAISTVTGLETALDGKVAKGGDTMTGALHLPAGGLVVHTNQLVVMTNGYVGIGTANPTNELAVNGTIKAKEIIATLDGWSDFVLEPDYELMPLQTVAAFVREKGHLPGIPSERDVRRDGVKLGDMQAKLLQKVEELTLYVIELNRENRALRHRLSRLETGWTRPAAGSEPSD